MSPRENARSRSLATMAHLSSTPIDAMTTRSRTSPSPASTAQPASLGAYAGKVLLVVNVASKCGLTPQYAGLEKLYEDKRAQGLEVLGFPANDFGAQEPGTDAEISEFCSLTYDVKFPLFSKISVLGADQHPLYASLTAAQPAAIGDGAVPRTAEGLRHRSEETRSTCCGTSRSSWSADGQVVARFAAGHHGGDPRWRRRSTTRAATGGAQAAQSASAEPPGSDARRWPRPSTISYEMRARQRTGWTHLATAGAEASGMCGVICRRWRQPAVGERDAQCAMLNASTAATRVRCSRISTKPRRREAHAWSNLERSGETCHGAMQRATSCGTHPRRRRPRTARRAGAPARAAGRARRTAGAKRAADAAIAPRRTASARRASGATATRPPAARPRRSAGRPDRRSRHCAEMRKPAPSSPPRGPGCRPTLTPTRSSPAASTSRRT